MIRERVTWNGDSEDDLVEDGEAEREFGRPKPRKRLALVGDNTESERVGARGAEGAVLDCPADRRM